MLLHAAEKHANIAERLRRMCLRTTKHQRMLLPLEKLGNYVEQKFGPRLGEDKPTQPVSSHTVHGRAHGQTMPPAAPPGRKRKSINLPHGWSTRCGIV